jgi:small subunit ribosomal protein S21
LFDIANICWQVKWNIFWKNSGTQMQVSVRDNNVDQALRALKKKLQSEGVFREMRLKEQFEKPSDRKAREKKESISRQRKLARKKAEREG